MSHGYSLRPNAKGRMEKRLNAYVAAFGEENKNNIVAAPSETGEGIRLIFDRERSLEPVPGGPIEQGYTTNTTDEDDVIIMDDDNDSEESDSGADCDTDSGSESDTSESSSPQTPPRVHFEPTSALRTPRPQRHGEQRQQEDWREGSVASSVSVADSMTSLVERGRVLRSQLQDVQAGRRRVEEQRRAEGQRIRVEQIHRLFEEQESILRERLTALQQEYEQVIAGLDQEQQSEAFSIKEEFEAESNFEYTPTETSESEQRHRSATPWPYPGHENRQKSLTPWAEPGNVPPNVTISPSPSPPPVAGPSRMGPSMMEHHRQEQSVRGLRRQHAQHMVIPQHEHSRTTEFVTVTQRVQKVGPSGTAMFDAFTNEPVLETKRYRVRADVLQGIDGDSDMEEL